MNAYLDNSATTRPCERAVERMNRSMREGYFNPSALYAPASEAEKAMNECRKRVLAPLNGAGHELVFASGGTEANNLAILGSIAAMYGTRHAVTCEAEHPSVLSAFDRLEALGHRVTRVGVDEAGHIDMDALERALRDGASLLSLMHVNNETGAIHDIAQIAEMARRMQPEALIHVDGVQGYLRLPFDARLVDLYTLSAHKIHGPKGVGALAVRKGVRLQPRALGGGQEGGLRSGTENTVGIQGLLGAVEHMAQREGIADRLMEKKLRLLHKVLDAVPDALVNGPAPESGAPHILNLSFPGVRAEVMLHALEGDGIYCATGSACSSKKRKASSVLTAMGLTPTRTESALRFSLSIETTDDEIDWAAERIAAQYGILRQFRRR